MSADIVGFEKIRCQSCGHLQLAPVRWPATDEFPTYVHTCVRCAHVITESEWDLIPEIESGEEGDA